MSSSPIFHPNQIETANKIIAKFEHSNYGMLFAQMQCGKTGTSLFTAFKMIDKEIIDNVIIFSGTSDKFLQKQWNDTIDDLRDEYNEIHKENRRVSHKNIKVIWRQELKKEKNNFKKEKTLIIWDESHYGSTQKQTIDKELGVLFGDAFRGDTSEIKQKSIYILTVTATRCAEQSRHYYNLEAKKNWFSEILKPGDDYFGIKDYMENNLIIERKPLLHQDYIKNIIDENIDYENPKIFIIRYSGTPEKNKYIRLIDDYLKSIQETIDLQEYNSETKKDDAEEIYQKLFVDKPNIPRIIIIKGLFRMGALLYKENLCGVWETSKDPKHNTILQGLPGRVCGYGGRKDIRIYVPSLEPIKEYINYIDNYKNVGLTHTQHIAKKQKKSEGKMAITFPILIRKDDLPIIADSNNDDHDYNNYQELFVNDKQWNNEEEIASNLEGMIEYYFKINPKLKISADHERDEFFNVIRTSSIEDYSFRNSHKNGVEQYSGRLSDIVDNIQKNPVNYFDSANVILLKFTNNYKDIKAGSIILMVTTDNANFLLRNQLIKRTKGRSIHDDQVKEQEGIVMTQTAEDNSNGMMGFSIDKNTRNNPSTFKDELKKSILFRQVGGWHSTSDNNITFDKSKYPNGIHYIIKELEEEYNVKIKLLKSRGKQPLHFWKYTKIIWSPK